MRRVGFLALGALLFGACTAPALLVTGPPDAVEVARFREAVALAVDPVGRTYVVDAGASTVFVFTPSGALLTTLGGAGAGTRAFAEPVDIDPTNGLVRVVADAGTGQVVRFDDEGAHLGTLLIELDRQTGAGAEPSVSSRQPNPYRQSGARPVAVAVAGTGETYVIEGTQGVVGRWDATYTLDRVFGGVTSGEGALADPMDLAVTNQAVYVADAGRGAVLAYDRYGAFLGQLIAAPGVRALQAVGDDVLVTTALGVVLYGADGTQRWSRPWQGSEPLVRAAVGEAGLFWLTSSRLYRTSR